MKAGTKYCAHCKRSTYHVIAVWVGDKTEHFKCNTCGRQKMPIVKLTEAE